MNRKGRPAWTILACWALGALPGELAGAELPARPLRGRSQWRLAVPNGKNEPAVRAAFQKALEKASAATVRILADGEEVALGAIVEPDGYYGFNGIYTGYAMADMLLGMPNYFEASPDLFDPNFRFWEIMPWVQDDWRVTKNLTLNLGLRYERWGRPESLTNSIANPRLPASGDQITMAVAAISTPWSVRPATRMSRPAGSISCTRSAKDS